MKTKVTLLSILGLAVFALALAIPNTMRAEELPSKANMIWILDNTINYDIPTTRALLKSTLYYKADMTLAEVSPILEKIVYGLAVLPQKDIRLTDIDVMLAQLDLALAKLKVVLSDVVINKTIAAQVNLMITDVTNVRTGLAGSKGFGFIE